jgi:hypothetical protein
MKIQWSLLFCGLFFAGVVNSKTPECGSNQATSLLSRSLAAKLQELGVDAKGLEKQIKINDIQVLKRDQKLDRYSCQANFSVIKPPGLADKIYKLFVQHKGDDVLRALSKSMVAKYGFDGNTVAGTAIGVIGNGMGMIDFMALDGSPQERASGLRALRAFLDEVSSAYPIPVGYQVFETQTDGRMRAALNWRTQDDGDLQLTALLFLINDALN